MAKISKPVSFSSHFGIPPKELTKLGTYDPLLNADTKLFLDPLLLATSRIKEFKESKQTYNKYFRDVLKLIKASKSPGDVAWRQARKRLTFHEVSWVGLGYSAGNVSGKGIGKVKADQLLDTATQIVSVGVDDPDLFGLLPLLQEGVGPDLIGDITTNIILPHICEFTQRVCKELKIPTTDYSIKRNNYKLPSNPLNNFEPILLVSIDALTELPVAEDWEEISQAVAEAEEIRSRVSAEIGAIWAAKTREERLIARTKVLSDPEALGELIKAARKVAASYAKKGKTEGYKTEWHSLLGMVASQYPHKIPSVKLHSTKELNRVIESIINQFQLLVEQKGLWKMFWNGDKPVGEEIMQKLFFAVAYSYCDSNGLDISPEAETGRGPVDFKFSKGNKLLTIVEIKRSQNAHLANGYVNQLAIYKKASGADLAYYLVIDTLDREKQLKRLLQLKNDAEAKGEETSPIFWVDATKKLSASKV